MLGNLPFRIVRGWWFFINGKNKELMNSRLEVCNQCVFRKWIVCGACGCELHAKASDPEEHCPYQDWPGENARKS